MTQKQYITMSKYELSKYTVIQNLIDERINGTEAAKQIGVSIRHVKRLKAKFDKNDAECLIHGNRGKESNRKISV